MRTWRGGGVEGRSAWTWGEQCAIRGRAWYVEAAGDHCCGAKQMETLGFPYLGLLLLGHYFGLFYVIGHLGQVFLFGFIICKWIFNIFVLFFRFCIWARAKIGSYSCSSLPIVM
ncbi:hypothetical protein ES332_A12G176000v1 [Gossypium tomentosum]|uniref:Uncharacterized protein n=1 Tax=Gossypium tomentosum TaxID=34277 RepID=A0A5D2MXU2_GOSTO|nr:hypothetical protein ES332_A12G176000v1 [Gossypium tomentosum]